jgi:hypothetical protein
MSIKAMLRLAVGLGQPGVERGATAMDTVQGPGDMTKHSPFPAYFISQSRTSQKIVKRAPGTPNHTLRTARTIEFQNSSTSLSIRV